MHINYEPTDAILKGIIEHGDAARHFGSTGALAHYLREAVRGGLLTMRVSAPGGYVPTAAGVARYDDRQLGALPDARWCFWK